MKLAMFKELRIRSHVHFQGIALSSLVVLDMEKYFMWLEKQKKKQIAMGYM